MTDEVDWPEEWAQALIEERTRALAQPIAPDRHRGVLLLVCAGRESLWAVPVAAVRRVEPLPPWTPIPGRTDAVLGLALVGGERAVVADLDALAAGLPPRTADRPGHAIALREGGVVLAVDRAMSVSALEIEDAPLSSLGRGIARAEFDDRAVVVLDAGAVTALVQAQAGGRDMAAAP